MLPKELTRSFIIEECVRLLHINHQKIRSNTGLFVKHETSRQVTEV